MNLDLFSILKTTKQSSTFFLKITFLKTFSKFLIFLLITSLLSILFFNIKKNTNIILCSLNNSSKSFHRIPPRGHDPLVQS